MTTPIPRSTPTAATAPAKSQTRRLSWPRVNISAAEQAGRITVGAVVLISAAIWMASAMSALPALLLALLMLAGLDLVVTGGLGHCPLYGKLGHTPALRRRTR